MTTVAEALAHIEAIEQRRAAEQPSEKRLRAFWSSAQWRRRRFQYLASLEPEERRCVLCGASNKSTRLVVDHVYGLRTPEGWARRFSGPFQLLCSDENLIKGDRTMNFKEEQTNVCWKGSHDATDLRLNGVG